MSFRLTYLVWQVVVLPIRILSDTRENNSHSNHLAVLEQAFTSLQQTQILPDSFIHVLMFGLIAHMCPSNTCSLQFQKLFLSAHQWLLCFHQQRIFSHHLKQNYLFFRKPYQFIKFFAIALACRMGHMFDMFVNGHIFLNQVNLIQSSCTFFINWLVLYTLMY